LAQELVLIRHGYLGKQYEGRFVGSTDAPLADEGPAQVACLAERVDEFADAKCFCSPMLRTRQTADAMMQQYETDEDLREIDFGSWECKTFEEISASDPDMVGRWAEYADDFAFPDGESIGGFNDRVRRFTDRVASEPNNRILAVTHGGVIRTLICHFLGLELRNYLLFEAKPASISRIAIYEGKGVLTQLNDTCHLRGCTHG
jgi:alpha-ribazole phosphatase